MTAIAIASSESEQVTLASLSLEPAAASSSTSTSIPKAKAARTPRPRPADDAETMYSKALSYILRHGAAKESLTLTDEGFIRVDQLVSSARSWLNLGFCS